MIDLGRPSLRVAGVLVRVLEKTYALMGPWDFVAFVQYPYNETAFRALAKIGKLEVVKAETFQAEELEVFWKALV